MKATIIVTLKNGVLDPQGKAIEGALSGLGFEGIHNVRQGKFFEMDIDADSPDAARKSAESACEKLLANTVIENYKVIVE
jgi:phosphoribosylformylglycinamidine synthase